MWVVCSRRFAGDMGWDGMIMNARGKVADIVAVQLLRLSRCMDRCSSMSSVYHHSAIIHCVTACCGQMP